MTTAVIVAAGSSRRMGFPKLTVSLLGKPVLRWTLEAFDACRDVEHVIVVVGDATEGLVSAWKEDGILTKPMTLVQGAEERYLSVHAGLQQLPTGTEIVAVHDGARPLITPEQITRCIFKAKEVKALACARPVTETLKQVDADGRIAGSVSREGVWLMETPQVFDRTLLCHAYDKAVAEGLAVTDEVSAVQHAGSEVFVLDNPEPNLKITYPADLHLAEQLLRARA